MMDMASGPQARPLRLDSPNAEEAQSSEGGQIVQELNSIREGKYWDVMNVRRAYFHAKARCRVYNRVSGKETEEDQAVGSVGC